MGFLQSGIFTHSVGTLLAALLSLWNRVLVHCRKVHVYECRASCHYQSWPYSIAVNYILWYTCTLATKYVHCTVCDLCKNDAYIYLSRDNYPVLPYRISLAPVGYEWQRTI